ncbi:MAG: DUF2442 domain-containing protein [Nitrospirae bacterium]|nr:DUF2442 domain-containing protein [Nitrospirota bacterium]MBF0542350.1 DUF2442 domain-containing protein [Nitrospirota bacterium]
MRLCIGIFNSKKVGVISISSHGIWLFYEDKELFLSYEEFPWFKEAKTAQILNVVLLHGKHLYWPDLDVDLSIDSIKNPEKYPLTARIDG